MKDKWLNTTFEDNVLHPFKEDLPNYNDPERIREFALYDFRFLLLLQAEVDSLFSVMSPDHVKNLPVSLSLGYPVGIFLGVTKLFRSLYIATPK